MRVLIASLHSEAIAGLNTILELQCSIKLCYPPTSAVELIISHNSEGVGMAHEIALPKNFP